MGNIDVMNGIEMPGRLRGLVLWYFFPLFPSVEWGSELDRRKFRV